MFNKKIVNIVFYTVPNGTEFTKQATLFLADGTVKNVTFEEGIDACEEIVREKGIQTKDAFKEMINHDIVHVTTAEDFRNRFESFVPAIKPVEISEEKTDEDITAETITPTDEQYSAEDDDFEDIYTDSDDARKDDMEDVYSYSSEEERDFLSDDDLDEYEDDDELDKTSDEELEEEKEGFFKRVWKKIKNSHAIKAIVACVTAAALAVGIYSCAKRQTKEGTMANSNLSSTTSISDKNIEDNSVINYSEGAYTKESFKNDATIKALFDRTVSEQQKTTMINTGYAMDGFNNVFAYQHKEKGKDIRPALKFDEVIALQVAYNDYSRDQLVAIFNGADIRSGDMSRAYKDANLQLMGAYAMEDPKHPVDMSMLIESQEGKDFYKKYHEAFLAIKTAKDDEKAKYANQFYKMVRKDFPVTEKVRTEGISHAENYESITAYKLSVAPMIAAAEMMWQNLKTDVTLNDMEVDFINDLGLCNYADKTFERAELLSLSNPVDSNNPTFEEYRKAFIKFYKDHDIYYVDDEHRELTKLQAFQDAVNWHFKKDVETVTTGGKGETKTTTQTTTKTWTKTETSTHEEVTEREVPITPEGKEEVDKQLEEENERNRRKAEEEAERERQRLQEEEDRNAERVEEEVRKDEEDLQNRIDQANDTIDRNNSDDDKSNDTPINENDLGHGVDFDDEHSDENGNLDSSVSNITTDSTGDKTNEPLPDPNETGKEYDAKANKGSSNNKNSNNGTSTDTTPNSSSNSEDQWVESVQVADDYYYEDAWVEYEDDVDYSDAVNSYVESMANGSEEDSAGYSYHK